MEVKKKIDREMVKAMITEADYLQYLKLWKFSIEESKHSHLNPIQFILEHFENPVIRKFFDPVYLQRLTDTIPPVWDFIPKKFYFGISDDNEHLSIYLCGSFLEQSSMKYYLGKIPFKLYTLENFSNT